ncbi:unnamed protein product [Onchocerca ochengi]|uniref:TOG domain-containing protein n=1 Tax=Onchocerca ochengi TaxID=42157 RepID=A0A182E5A0_ONCOC|nr:unnamed protein product [Onchocerca ochengi]
MQTVLAFVMSTVLLWWGCCRRSIQHEKEFRYRSVTSDGVTHAPGNSGTRTSKTLPDDVPLLSKSRSIPHITSEKSLETTQAETTKLIQSRLKSKSLKVKKNLDLSQPEEDNVQLSDSVDRIRLEKLQLDSNLHQKAYNDNNMIHKNAINAVNAKNTVGKRIGDENFAENGYTQTKSYKSDGNLFANNISQNGKVSNPNALPSKSGNNYDGYAPSEPAIPTRSLLSLVKKSLSHQNLACTSKSTGISQRAHASLKKNNKDNLSGKLKSASSMRSIVSNSSSIASISRRNKGIQNMEALLKNPESSLNDALEKLDAEDWNGKFCAIEVIIALAEMSPDVLVGNIHRVCLVLMQKAGDVTNAFIRDDATIALEKMIKYASPGRSLNALVTAGAKSKSNTIRACCANLLIKLVERMGSINAVSSVEFPRFVTSLLLFARDANVIVRQTGKYGIRLLSQNNDLFDDAVRKSLNESERQNLRDVLEAINRKGMEESHLGSSTTSLGSISISRSSSVRRSGSNGRDATISQGIQQDLMEIRNNLIANEWERRMKGLKEFSEIVMKNDRAAISDTKVLGAFVGRTSDINFKVSVEAMETLITILPTLSPHFSKEPSLKTVLYQLVNSLMSHLASRSEGHRQHAKLCFEEITKYIENITLLASFSSATKQANVKQKPFMLHTLGKLMESVYSIKPRQVEATGLPVLWELLKTPPRSCSDLEVRDAIRNYAITLARCFGVKTLLELSTFRISPSQKKTLQELVS